jgi:adenine-specific DNA-methyltransferase
MSTLEWIGKEKVINHHPGVPFRVLEEQYTYNAETSDDMITQGNNLEALKSLLPQYEGRVKCIYIDFPYNTGEENWVYNDNVNVNDPRNQSALSNIC